MVTSRFLPMDLSHLDVSYLLSLSSYPTLWTIGTQQILTEKHNLSGTNRSEGWVRTGRKWVLHFQQHFYLLDTQVFLFFFIRFTLIKQIHINRDNKVGKFKQLRYITFF